MTSLATLEPASELVATIERARHHLDEGDAQAALMLASGAYEQAKAAGTHATRVKASRALVDKARRMQADALKIETLAYCAMADQVDAAQAKGEIGRHGRPKNVSGENVFTLEEVGVDRQHLHQARQLRNAERQSPGFVDRFVESRLVDGLEPSRASLKKAAGHALGTKTATKEERGDDLYETPIEAMRTLLSLEGFSGTVLEPSVGRGAILRPLEAAGYEVRIFDAVDRGVTTQAGEAQGVADFLALSGPSKLWSVGMDIVTNPPYGIANAYIAHALRAFRPGKMAMLLNLNFLCGFEDADRCFVMDENPPSRIYVFTRRLPMMHRDGWDGPKASSQMNTAWFVWERNADGSYGAGHPELIRVDWKAHERAVALAPGESGHAGPLVLVEDDEEDDDVDSPRTTPRKTVDERVGEEAAKALIWMADQAVFDQLSLRRGFAVRPLVADALIADFLAKNLIAPADGGFAVTEDGWRVLKACAGALVGLSAAEAVAA